MRFVDRLLVDGREELVVMLYVDTIDVGRCRTEVLTFKFRLLYQRLNPGPPQYQYFQSYREIGKTPVSIGR